MKKNSIRNAFVAVLCLLSLAFLLWSLWNPLPIVKFVLRYTDVMERIRKNSPLPPKGVALDHTVEVIKVKNTTAIWLDRKNSFQGVLVYLHGGAYLKGPFETQWKYVSRMIRKTSMAALVIDYKMPPGFPFPHGLEGSLELIRELQKEGSLANRWFLLGDSAGGGLALAIAFRLRETKSSLPQGLILMSPWLDLNMDNPNVDLVAPEDPMLKKKFLIDSANQYAPNADLKNPLISPVYGDVKGLPPILLQTGTSDILLPDIRKFYEKCKENGVSIRYEEYPEAFHVFMMLNPLKEARRAIDSQKEFLLR
ncbi:alpha/beta hydrolase [Leptospira kmetyi]|uniref:alpha/beta hydrolase n=1 Tax=Leptospira kmetyi TaxID=408139 RepID=UPI000289F195|nr:alpha/beta hydrolase [Leptospira kmetyi]EQA52406.1 hydrolase, alpha/beta domain protein [Leptospira kmetyi serovar Malaysia str. Bejo-Iso9]